MALAVGAILGIVYGFLRPLRRWASSLADGLFVLAAAVGWVYLGFGLCEGDLRLGYTGGMVLGGFLWELTLGRLLRPVYQQLWKYFFRFLSALWWPVGKISGYFRKILKNLFAFWKKWVTIKKKNNQQKVREDGGATHDRAKKKRRKAGIPQEQACDPGGCDNGRRIVYGGTGDAP